MADLADFTWPAEAVSLTEAARLFTALGHPIDRTNLGRWVESRNFPAEKSGASVWVDAKHLFELWVGDYGRLTMSGQTNRGDPAADSTAREPATARVPDGGRAASDAPAVVSSDPRRRESELKVQERELNLARQLRLVVPVEEVEAAVANAIGELRAAFNKARSDTAMRLARELGLPAAKVGQLRAGLKAYARDGQAAFAASWAPLTRAIGEPDSAAVQRLTQLVALSLRLRPDPDHTDNQRPQK